MAPMCVTNFDANTVTRLRASDGTMEGTFAVGHAPTGILFDGINIWVANQNDDTVTKIRPSDGATLGTFPTHGDLSLELAFDGANIWVTADFSESVTKLRASDGA